MKYRFKAINYSKNIDLFDRSYVDHEAAMQAAFAYVDLFVESDDAIDGYVHSIVSANNDSSMSFIHDDTVFIIAPDRKNS